MANICCDDVYFFSDDNTEGIEALWKDLQASITPGYKDDLGQIERLFLHGGLSTEGINLRGTVVAMERTDHAVQLSLDTAWRRFMTPIQHLRQPTGSNLSWKV